MEKELPKNWVKTSPKEIANIIRGVSYGKNDASQENFDGSCLILRGGNIQDGKIVEGKDNVFVDLKLIKKEQFIQKGDVVIVGSTGSKQLIGKAATVLESSSNISFGAFLMNIRAYSNINKSFFSYYFQTDYYRSSIRELAGGVNINNIRKEYIESLYFPLPPLSEQNRIVEKLDRLFGQLEVIKISMEKIPFLLKNFRQQVLTQAVTGKLTEEWREGEKLKDWRKEKLGDICNLKAGKFVSASDINNENEEGFFPCYGGNGLRGFVKSFTHIGKFSLIGRQGALCGNVHLIEGHFHATEHALVVTPISNINESWLFHKLTSLELINYSKGVAQPGLSVMNLNPILLDVPPIEEQQEIVSRIESLFSKADAIEEKYKNLKAKIETLPQTILHKAFKGELSEQLESDGDARDLLEEIVVLKNGGKTKKVAAKKYVQPDDEVLRIVAEESLSYPTLSTRDKKVQRKMLATHIINQSLEDKSFGKTKFEKLLHLIECHVLQRDLNQNYSVQAAGPYDGGFTKTFWDEVLKSKWFAFEQQGTLKRIVSGENQNKSVKEYGYFSNEEKQKINDFIAIFENTNYERPEIVSTLYAVWNNRIKRNEAITDHLLKEDFLNWDPGKAKYKDRLDKALEWMRENGIVPNGWGNEIKRSKRK